MPLVGGWHSQLFVFNIEFWNSNPIACQCGEIAKEVLKALHWVTVLGKTSGVFLLRRLGSRRRRDW